MTKPETAREIILSLKDRFRPEKAEPGYETVFHFEISGDRGGEFTITIEDEKINIEEGLHHNPKCVVNAKDTVYEDVEWNRTNPQMAFLMGKVKVSDISEMLNFAGLFYRCENFYN